ncbi:MAG: glycosyltransferase family 4 protein [Euryarchaeota archaeon]|nr:glycosyltransferase family 4 protein [Euryarchaeota archaeon]
MKILQLAVRFPPAPGGVETHVAELSKRFLERGHEVSVLTTDLHKEVPFTRRPTAAGEVAPSGVRVTRFPAMTFGGDAHYVVSPGLVRRAVAEAGRFDVMHAHSYGYLHTVAGAFGSRLADRAFVFTPHFHPSWSMEFGARRRRLRAVFDRFVAPFVWNSCDRIISVSGEEERLMSFPRSLSDRVVRVPNGIDLARFRRPAEGNLFRKTVPVGGRYVLYIGRLASNKGLRSLVEAHSRIASAGVSLVIAGEDQGIAPELLSLASRLGTADRVHIPGHLEADVLLSALSGCELLVLPSEYEAFGIVLLEAMAAGKPVVATRVGGIPEVVTDGVEGLLVEYGDVGGLARAIDTVLSEAKARGFGEAGRKRSQRYDWDAIADSTLRVYRDAIASRRRPPRRLPRS